MKGYKYLLTLTQKGVKAERSDGAGCSELPLHEAAGALAGLSEQASGVALSIVLARGQFEQVLAGERAQLIQRMVNQAGVRAIDSEGCHKLAVTLIDDSITGRNSSDRRLAKAAKVPQSTWDRNKKTYRQICAAVVEDLAAAVDELGSHIHRQFSQAA